MEKIAVYYYCLLKTLFNMKKFLKKRATILLSDAKGAGTQPHVSGVS